MATICLLIVLEGAELSPIFSFFSAPVLVDAVDDVKMITPLKFNIAPEK